MATPTWQSVSFTTGQVLDAGDLQKICDNIVACHYRLPRCDDVWVEENKVGVLFKFYGYSGSVGTSDEITLNYASEFGVSSTHWKNTEGNPVVIARWASTSNLHVTLTVHEENHQGCKIWINDWGGTNLEPGGIWLLVVGLLS